jgi:hypothetical protein
MPGRKFQQSTSSYRYSINGQEKESELNENITTALYWEYDSRIVRRWNIDPKPSIGISVYSSFANNPILLSDPFGDTTEIRSSKGTYINTLNDKGTLKVFVVNSKYDKFFEPLKGVDLSKLNNSFLKRFKSTFATAGITYDVNTIRKFYNIWSKSFEVKMVGVTPIAGNKITLFDSKGKRVPLRPLYAEAVLKLSVIDYNISIPNTKPESDNNLLSNFAGRYLKIHFHTDNGSGKIILSGPGIYSDTDFKSEVGPSGKIVNRQEGDYDNVGDRKDESRDILVDKNKIYLYNDDKLQNIELDR